MNVTNQKLIKALVTTTALSLSGALLSGCSTPHHQPTGEYVWINHNLYEQQEKGDITSADLDHEYLIAQSKCKIQSLQIPIPSPSCTARQVTSCAGLAGLALGMCQGAQVNNSPVCDYSASNAAVEAQDQIYSSCMVLDGWDRVWQPY
jgi:hypothetical protein